MEKHQLRIKFNKFINKKKKKSLIQENIDLLEELKEKEIMNFWEKDLILNDLKYFIFNFTRSI